MARKEREEASGGIFISHCHEDNALAVELAEFLESRGYSVYVDVRSLKGGDNLIRRIARFINAAAKVVAILSRASIGRRWVQTEIEWTLTRELKEKIDLLVPFVVDDDALGWFRDDICLGNKLAIVEAGSDKSKGFSRVLDALPPLGARETGTRSPRDPLSESDVRSLDVVDLVAQSVALAGEGKGDEAAALAGEATRRAREAGMKGKIPRLAESIPRQMPGGEEPKEGETVLEYAPGASPLRAAALTHPGKVREENEDAFGISPEHDLVLVSDGMGGANAGAVASRIVTQVLPRLIRKRLATPLACAEISLAVRDAIVELGAEIQERGN
ncbi:MAG: TIR domain-containing protein [Planctomycetes bacterium]|nr:TIR domain-containing protein [Planctomycetota bacterium]